MEPDPPTAKDEVHRELARYWAPRFFQDTDSSYYLGDYVTKFNFDGDYNGKNNWENLERFETVPAYVYYAVSETETHYFIHYALFHPRDWHEWLPAERHENDLEGATLLVEKSGEHGRLIAVETLAHDQFYQYTAGPRVSHGSEDYDGPVTLFEGHHPRLFVEAKGHGLFACDSRCDRAPGGDGIVYAEGGFPGEPEGGRGDFEQVVSYSLIAFEADGSLDDNQGFWYRRYDICDSCTFGAWGKLRGDDFAENRAKTAWAWDDPDDGAVFAGALLCDPATLFAEHLGADTLGNSYSRRYLGHEFYTHEVDLLAVRSVANRDWFGGRSDVYVEVSAADSPMGSDVVASGRDSWQEDAETGVWYPYERRPRSYFYCRPPHVTTRLAVYDHDTGLDELMGQATLEASASHESGMELGDASLRFVYRVRSEHHGL